MNKERFNKLIVNYSELDSHVEDLNNLVKEFPYSQPVRMLSVRSSYSLPKKEFQERLGLAAFYTTDRNVLRSLIEKGKVPSDIIDETINQVQKSKRILTKPDSSLPTKTLTQPLDAEQLRKEVLANLEILQQTKSSFLQLSELKTTTKKKVKKSTAKKTTPARKSTKAESKKSLPKESKSINSPKTKTTNKKNELIDKFIEDKPSITPGKATTDNQSDLSKASSELKEDLVSENLAIIFAKQGKANKAIEIYKKLIWKFPQKKASFAARIEELKKK